MASSGDVVESPNYPHKYAPLSNCKWTLEGPQGHNILLQVQRPRFRCHAYIVAKDEERKRRKKKKQKYRKITEINLEAKEK